MSCTSSPPEFKIHRLKGIKNIKRITGYHWISLAISVRLGTSWHPCHFHALGGGISELRVENMHGGSRLGSCRGSLVHSNLRTVKHRERDSERKEKTDTGAQCAALPSSRLPQHQVQRRRGEEQGHDSPCDHQSPPVFVDTACDCEHTGIHVGAVLGEKACRIL